MKKWIVLLVVAILGIAIFTFSIWRGNPEAEKAKAEAAKLLKANEEMKQSAKEKDEQYSKTLNQLSQQTFAVKRKLGTLEKENQALVESNRLLVQEKAELEKKYADLEIMLKEVKVPATRTDRVKLFNQLCR